ncbi:6-bladed beta-propeller [Portibacter lacus]|nr:6-bladed beta-propeller [Portibacter lacus]
MNKSKMVSRLISNFILVFMLSILLVACNSDKNQSEVTNNLAHAEVVNYNEPEDFIMSEHIDSITFVPLKAPYTFGWVSERIKITDQHIYFLYTPYPDACYLIICDRKGNFVHQIVSESNDQQNIVTISDIEILNDTLYVLHDDKISVYNTFDFSKIGESIFLQDRYQEFEKTAFGFLCYNAAQGLHKYDNKGIFLSADPLLDNYPSNILDLLYHFSDIINSENFYFYFGYNPSLYIVENRSGKLINKITNDVGKYNITENELNSIIQAGPDVGAVKNNICRTLHKMCYMNNVYDLSQKIIHVSRFNNRTHFLSYDKKTREPTLYDKVINDTGLPFLTEYEYFYNFGSYKNEIIGVIDPEYINMQLEDISDQKIPSNWDKVADQINEFSNPVVVLYLMKGHDKEVVAL